MGLNISKICKDALKVYIEAIKQADQQIYKRKGMKIVGAHRVVGPPGFEPGIASAPGWYPRPS